MSTWFTSDQHFGHTNIIKYSGRPFADVDMMNNELIARFNAAVSPEDDVWHVGDFSLDEVLVKKFLPLLRGKHHLISGNHDRCHPTHRKSAAAMQRYLRYGFVDVRPEHRVGQFRLCHLPYEPTGPADERYADMRPKDKGVWLLCGHVHEAWKVRGRMINVGVDQWAYAPVKLETLEVLAAQSAGKGTP